MKPGKLLVSIVVAVVALLVVAALLFYIFGESAVRRGVETAASKTLQVDVALGGVNLALMRGGIDLSDLSISNPEGYQNPTLLRLGSGKVQARISSLLTDTVNIDHILLDDIELTIEQKGLTNNLQQILKNIQETMPEGEPDAEGKDLHIDRLELTNIAVHVKLLPVPGQTDTLTLRLDPITMENLGTDEPIDAAALTAKIITALAAGVARQGADILPTEMIGDLASGIRDIGGSVVEQSLDVLKGAGSGIIEGTRDVGDSLRGIFRRQEQEE